MALCGRGGEVDRPVHNFAIKKGTAGGGWMADVRARPPVRIKWDRWNIG